MASQPATQTATQPREVQAGQREVDRGQRFLLQQQLDDVVADVRHAHADTT